MHNARSNEGERGRGGGRATFKLTIHALERARLERLRSKQKKEIRIEPGEVGRLVERERERVQLFWKQIYSFNEIKFKTLKFFDKLSEQLSPLG